MRILGSRESNRFETVGGRLRYMKVHDKKVQPLPDRVKPLTRLRSKRQLLRRGCHAIFFPVACTKLRSSCATSVTTPMLLSVFSSLGFLSSEVGPRLVPRDHSPCPSLTQAHSTVTCPPSLATHQPFLSHPTSQSWTLCSWRQIGAFVLWRAHQPPLLVSNVLRCTFLHRDLQLSFRAC